MQESQAERVRPSLDDVKVSGRVEAFEAGDSASDRDINLNQIGLLKLFVSQSKELPNVRIVPSWPSTVGPVSSP